MTIGVHEELGRNLRLCALAMTTCDLLRQLMESNVTRRLEVFERLACTRYLNIGTVTFDLLTMKRSEIARWCQLQLWQEGVRPTHNMWMLSTCTAATMFMKTLRFKEARQQQLMIAIKHECFLIAPLTLNHALGVCCKPHAIQRHNSVVASLVKQFTYKCRDDGAEIITEKTFKEVSIPVTE